MESVRWDELIPDEQWDNEARSDIEVKKSRDQFSKEVITRYNEDSNKESRVISHPDVGRPVSRTEASLTLSWLKRNRSPRDQKSVLTDFTRFWHRALQS